MVKKINCLKTLIGVFLILCQVSDGWCDGDLSPSLVRIVSGRKYLCTGTLVRINYVVTSANCLKNQHNAIDLFIEANIQGHIPDYSESSNGIAIYIHEDYNEFTRHMDVAVIKLASNIKGQGIEPAKLCNLESIPESATAVASAWISYKPRALRVESHELSVTDDIVCLSHGNWDKETMKCTIDSNRDTCFIDTGFPAAIQGQFCGVFSSISGCNLPIKSHVFVSLTDPKVRQFIAKSLGEETC